MQREDHHRFGRESEWSCVVEGCSWSILAVATQRSGRTRARQIMRGVRKRRKPKGTIHSWVFDGWYLCSHHPSTKPPAMLTNKDMNKTHQHDGFVSHLLLLLPPFSSPSFDPIQLQPWKLETVTKGGLRYGDKREGRQEKLNGEELFIGLSSLVGVWRREGTGAPNNNFNAGMLRDTMLDFASVWVKHNITQHNTNLSS